jgi:hypothetical protein
MTNRKKTSITRHLFRSACEQVDNSICANKSGQIDDEVRFGISAILLVGVAIEGAINDVGEEHLGKTAWPLLERAQTVLKWFVLSKLLSEEGFLPENEPLKTVQDLKSLRDKIAHPKSMQIDDELIIRLTDGTIIEIDPKSSKRRDTFLTSTGTQADTPADDWNTIANRPSSDIDTIFEGYGRTLEKFGAKAAKHYVQRGYAAMKELNHQSTLYSFGWLQSLNDDFSWLNESV